MGLTVRNQNGVSILTPSGMLLGGKETEEFAEKISELDAAGDQRLILDMSRTSFMTSIGISAVLRAHISYAKRGAVVKICGLNKRMHEIFVMVRIAMVFGDNLHDTLEEALAAFEAMARETRPADAVAPADSSEESLVASETGLEHAGKGAAQSEPDR